MTAKPLDRKFDLFLSNLTPLEREHCRALLTEAAGDLAPHPGEDLTATTRGEAFRAVRHMLKNIVPSDILFRGRLPFLAGGDLRALQAEAEAGRAHAKYAERHRVGCGGPVADAFAVSEQLSKFVHRFAPGAVPTGIASYVHYDYDGAGLDPHVDSDIFSINVLIMLRHDYVDSPSHLILYPADEPAQRLLLVAGDVIIMEGAGLVHAREDMKAGERLSIVTFGFQRPAPED